MARLTIEQVAAPDFSASAELMRGAARSFNDGLESAQGILTKYNEGQQAKDDMFAIQEIAKARNEQELDTLLASGTLANLNLSDTLRNQLPNIRSDVIGNVNARDGNTRSNAAEGRTAAENIDMVAARAERRALTPSVVGAFNEANTTGSGPSTGNADFLRYSNQGATRNDPLSAELVNSMSFLSDMGITMDVVSGGQEDNGPNGTGSTRHNHGNSADADFYTADGRKLDWNNPSDVPIFQEIVQRARANGVTGIGAGDDYMGVGRMHVGFGAAGVWGADGRGENAPEWLRAAYEGAPQGTSGPVTSVGTGGQGYQNLSTAVAASLYMDPDEATSLLSGALTEQRATDARISAAEQLRQTQLGQEAQVAAITDPNNITTAQVQRDLIDTPGLSAANRLALGGGNYDAYGNIIAPAVTANPQATAAAELAAADAARENGLDPTVQAFEEAAAYDSAQGGAGAALTANLGEQATGVLDPANVDRALGQFAEANGITAGEAAVVFNSVAQGNADQLAAQLQAASDTDMYANLSSIADRMFGDSARSAYQDGKLADVGAAAQRDAVQANILVAKTEAAKLPAGSTERAAAEENIRLLEVGSIAANQPQKTKAQTAAYLGIEPAQMAELSPDDKRAAEQSIRSNPDLSIEEKTLLIMGLRL